MRYPQTLQKKAQKPPLTKQVSERYKRCAVCANTQNKITNKTYTHTFIQYHTKTNTHTK